MSILDRILLIILALAGLISAVVAIVIGSGYHLDLTYLAYYPDNIYTIVVGIVVALVSLRFLFYRLSAPAENSLVLPGDNGSIRISFEAIQQLSNRTGKLVRGVHEFDTRVRTSDNGIILSVRVKALPDIDLANMSAEIQNSVKNYVEKTSGCIVDRVLVNITELANTNMKPPRAWVES